MSDISLRLALQSDAPRLLRWRQEPQVAPWWNVPPYSANDVGEVEEELAGDAALEGHQSLLVLLDGNPIGYLQTYNAGRASGDWWPDESDATRGLDLLIGEPDLVGRGIGPRVVRLICARLFEEPDVESIIVDPHPDNARSIRCFEKAGFIAERRLSTPDGEALLMRLRREKWRGISLQLDDAEFAAIFCRDLSE